MSELTRSEEGATRNGISSTEEAFANIQVCRQDVENTKMNVGGSYGGSDGQKYQDLLQAWDDQAEVISRNLNDVIDTLNETLRANNLTQGSQKDAVDQEYTQSKAIFDALRG
ncbi:WXG100 family type VII secretion target [Streptomyces milbemycinicus]|uniref:WXG100 family type VII secretion target n=1 Tax=Streptomyces milbemycinicus TaxID=476552 RepID=A0ABW8LPJ6_9ACTN